MTRLFALVHSSAEAEEVAAAGFDGVAVDDPEIGAAGLAQLCRARDADPDRLTLTVGAGDARTIALFSDRVPDEAALQAAAVRGAAGVVVGSAGRLLDRTGIADLETVRARCRALVLQCGFAGGLEPPDLPRLLACTPDLLVVGRALRCGQAEAGALDPAALRLVRDLVPAASPPARTAFPFAVLGGAPRPDRIFLRDLVLPIAIGAYDSERGRLQRVRFAVEADLLATGRPTRDMRDVVSYDLFTDAIRALTTDRHVDFVETLAEEIAARVLAHPRVQAVRVTVEKLDVGPGAVGVSIERTRERPSQPGPG